MEEGLYRFPPNKRAEEADLGEQIDKIFEEAMEVAYAWVTNDYEERIVEELWDVIQAAEGALRKFPYHLVWCERRAVIANGVRRGDHEIEELPTTWKEER